jgi:hypothetical protein
MYGDTSTKMGLNMILFTTRDSAELRELQRRFDFEGLKLGFKETDQPRLYFFEHGWVDLPYNLPFLALENKEVLDDFEEICIYLTNLSIAYDIPYARDCEGKDIVWHEGDCEDGKCSL